MFVQLDFRRKDNITYFKMWHKRLGLIKMANETWLQVWTLNKIMFLQGVLSTIFGEGNVYVL